MPRYTINLPLLFFFFFTCVALGQTQITINNGNFESAAVGNYNSTRFFTGWNIDRFGGSPDIMNINNLPSGVFFDTSVSSTQGGNFLGLYAQDGVSNEEVIQSISGFIVGNTYTILFEEANLGYKSGGTYYDANGELIFNITEIGDLSSGRVLTNDGSGWKNSFVTFRATNSTHTINLKAVDLEIGGKRTYLVIDNLRINSHDFALSKSSASVNESGGTDSFNVQLNAQPTSDVVLNISSSDTSEVAISTSSLTFTSVNWNIPQSITLTGVDDSDSDGNKVETITVSVNDVNSEDSFDSSPDQTISVTNFDNDLTLLLLDTDSDNFVSDTDIVQITAIFSEPMTASPAISFGSLLNNIAMTATTTNTTWTYEWNVPAGIDGTVTATVSGTNISGNAYAGTDSITFTIDNTAPTVTLTDTDVDNVVKDSDNVTITATFNEDMATAPDISIVGLVTNVAMTATSSTTWTYVWDVPSGSDGTVTATVSGTDIAGNAYTGTDSITFTIDNTAPTLTLTDTDSDNVVTNSDNVTITATFNENMATAPDISIGSLVTNVAMTATSSTTWTYVWNVPVGNDGTVRATVSGTDIAGNAYAGTDSITFTIDNTAPTVTLTDTDVDDVVKDSDNVTITATFNENMTSAPDISIGSLVSNVAMTATSSTTWTYVWDVPVASDGTVTATVSGADISGNAYAGTDSITFTIDNTEPVVTLISSPNANGKYTDNDNNPANSDTISITLTFSEEVVVSSGTYPYLTLNTLPSQNAFYSGGSGTQTLTFSYMVMDGGETADLGVTNIVLPTGAFIKDLAGNPADLSLGALNASSDNLSDTKDIEIRAKDPTLTTLTAATNNGTTNFGATDGNTVTYNFTSDIDLLSSSVSMTFNSFPSQPTLTQSNSGNTYTLSFIVDANTPEGALQFNLFATDTHSSTLVPEENRTADYTQSAFNQTLIIDRTAPVITSTALTTPENSITGPTVVANEAVFSFSLSGGVDQSLFTINPITGVLSFVNAPDFEAPADSNADNIYDLEVRVTDIVGLTATQTIAVTVTDVSDTFGVDLRATEVQTTEVGGSSLVSVALFTQPTAEVTLNFSSSDSTEGIPSLNQMVFTTDNWNIDQTLNMTGQDDQDIDGDVAYNLLVSSVSSSDANYNSLTGISLGFVNVDNEIDTDGDGFFDYQDAFPIDPLEWLDTDSDAIGNNADLDDDGDGFSDVTEITCSSNSLDATDIPLDSDGDGVLDCQDEDDDNDGIMDSIDNCQFTPNIDQIDTDGDGEGDVCDSDDDNDGYLDTEDAFPLDATEWLDTDQDGIGNNSDTDDDNDGQTDEHETACGSDPLDANETSADADADGLPNCVDEDDDNDGVNDENDVFPLDATEWIDTDADGIGNNADTDDDNDGFTDLDELACNSDPLDEFSKPSDLDQDGLPDCVDADRDGDGYENAQDVFPDNVDEWSDADSDGLGDNFDVDDDNDGCLDTTDVFPFDPNECFDGDNDGIGDNEDPDDNNDGFEDDKLFSSGVLTPGSGGLEDTWKIINIERYPNARVTIYNRNAQEVFSALDYKNDWRGTYKNSGDLLPAGSYYYIVDPNNGEKALTGWLYITY
jgi:gliding motility-associated-like protein